jgi:hypothetical protein
MSKFVKPQTVLNIGGRRYGPGKARDAALEYVGNVCAHYSFHENSKTFRDYNDRHRILWRRVLPIFEQVLGPVKDRRNPRTLLEIDFINGTVDVIEN